MPRYKEYALGADTRVYMWQVIETLDELLNLAALESDELLMLEGFKSENRKVEWCATRALLKSIEKDAKISYNSQGIPQLNIDKHISISHSAKFVSIMLSSRKCGLDIEMRARDFEKVSHKYVSESENVLFDNHEYDRQTCLALIWSFKEAVFKYFQTENVDFRKDIQIKSLVNGGVSCLFREESVEGLCFIENDFIVSVVNEMED